jgi:branched-chain amino acid transport system ATP-binding protein
VSAPEVTVNEPVLRVERLSRRFGGLRAVDGVTFAVARGETIGVIGPNGAGKSTLVNLVTGHLKPTAGRVLIDGRDMTGAKPWLVAKVGVARTFQIVKPFRGMTVRENVAIAVLYGPPGVTRMADALTVAQEVLDRVGIGGKAEATPGELTIADARRLELAKALALKPRLLLLDEVMAGLHHAEIDASLELIDSLRREGITIIAVEHVMKAILSISDRVLVLHEGRVLTEGPPRSVMSDPRVIEAYLGHRYADREEQ